MAKKKVVKKSTAAHKHAYKYQGVKYTVKGNVPGSGAMYREYYDVYFCQECTDTKIKKLNYTEDTYAAISFKATPLAEEDI